MDEIQPFNDLLTVDACFSSVVVKIKKINRLCKGPGPLFAIPGLV